MASRPGSPHPVGRGAGVLSTLAPFLRGAPTWPRALSTRAGAGPVPRASSVHRDADGASTREHATVLVIDDDRDVRELLSEILRTEGYAPAAASNGSEALALLDRLELPPTAIVLDLMMPVMDGWEFLAHKGRDPRLSAIPVIVISASGRGVDGGASLQLEKPFEIDALVRAIHRCSGPR
jgi:two-component system, chemotaxis family, chemotaxis protein CheY